KQAPEEFQLALEYYQKALPLLRETRDVKTEARALRGKAEAYPNLNQPELARKEIDQAVAVAEKAIQEITSSELRVLSQPWMMEIYNVQVRILMQLHRKDPQAGYDQLALRASEQFRLRALLEMLSESRIELSQGIDPGYLARLNELQLK